jgi:hypothetical protein
VTAPSKNVFAQADPKLRQKAAAEYLGVSIRYFRENVDVEPKQLPGRGKRPLLVWSMRELDAWVERVSGPKSPAKGKAATA